MAFKPHNLVSPFAMASMDLVSYCLESPIHYNRNLPIYLDAGDPSRYLTANHTKTLVRKLVAGLNVAGAEHKDCILVHLFNSILYPAIFLGVIGTGCCFKGSNPAYTIYEMRQEIKLVRPKIIITTKDLLPKIQAALAKSECSSTTLYVVDNGIPELVLATTASTGSDMNLINDDEMVGDFHRFDELLACGEQDWVRIENIEAAKATVAVLWSTSGTTGMPKVAAASHYATIAQSLAWQSKEKKTYEVKRLVSLPFFHMFAGNFIYLDPLHNGHKTYVMPRFQLENYMQAIQRFRISETAMVPAMVAAINKSTAVMDEKLATLRCIWIAGGTFHVSVQRAFYQKLHSEAIIANLWGMTEVGGMTSFLWPERDDTGSVGRCLAGTDIRIISEAGDIVTSDNIPGEAFVRTPQQMSGYVENLSANSDIFTSDGYIRTGDIVYRCKGKYYVVDRKKDLIKVRGWQVSPAELEAVLASHPLIEEAAIVRKMTIGKEGREEESPHAFVVKNCCETLGETELCDFVNQKLASYKVPGGVTFMETLPKTATGKVLKSRLMLADTPIVAARSISSQHCLAGT